MFCHDGQLLIEFFATPFYRVGCSGATRHRMSEQPLHLLKTVLLGQKAHRAAIQSGT